ncbi:MAG: glycosyltransferase family 2 protein [Pseudomonadales bacterium]|nr:glycosyltransferase family 2 protein [Pseudomonadales bacterium]
MKISVIIRTYNEETYLGELLEAIARQSTDHEVETIIVDSGSTDDTLTIAAAHDTTIVHINKDEFTFGRSLNIGCEHATGDLLAFVSGHCVPADVYWLENLAKPLVAGRAVYSYGRQVGRDTTRFSEDMVFNKYYPEIDMDPQEGFFCNNANAMLRKDLWQQFKFNEELTGLEDMYLAKQIVVAGHRLSYVSRATVFHVHNETWRSIRIRYEREAIALREIMPEVHISFVDLISWILSSVYSDYKIALKENRFSLLGEIILYRASQYWGSFVGNHEHRKLSKERKLKYFYPNKQFERGA